MKKLTLAFAFLAGISMVLMMGVGTLDILGTNLFGLPIPAAYEFITTMIVVVVFFAVAHAQTQRAHIRVEILVDRLPPPLRFAADAFQDIVSALFYALISYFGWLSALRSFSEGEYASGLINFPIWPARFGLAIGATLMVLQCINGLALNFRRRDLHKK